MTQAVDFEALAARCEAATGPSAKLNHEIAAATGIYAPTNNGFTHSLDAAMTLVPEGWQVSEIGENWRAGGWHCTLSERPNEAQRRAYESGGQYIVDSKYGEAPTTALALCAAALRARDGEGV